MGSDISNSLDNFFLEPPSLTKIVLNLLTKTVVILSEILQLFLTFAEVCGL